MSLYSEISAMQLASTHIPLATQEQPGKLKKQWRELDESIAQQLAKQLDLLMAIEKVYLKNDLSLARLAQLLGISPHQASELLNTYLNTHFYDYLNVHRLQYACGLLRNPDCDLRIVDIVFESGFNNKNSFYRTFQQYYGVTPLTYRQNMQENQATPKNQTRHP